MREMHDTKICPDCLTRSGLSTNQYRLMDKIVVWSLELIRAAEAEALGVRFHGRQVHPIKKLTSDLYAAWESIHADANGIFKAGEPTDAQRAAFEAFFKAEGNGGATQADREREAEIAALWRKFHPGFSWGPAWLDDAIPF